MADEGMMNAPGRTSNTARGIRRVLLWACSMVVIVAAAGTFAGARGCEAQRAGQRLKEGERVDVVVAGRTFRMEPALDEPTRVLGLGGRAKIEEDGGMIFVFPVAHRMEFVMRDCLTDIDIAFLDDSGRVLTIHEMKVEEPRRPDEPKVEPPGIDPYDARLKRYPSRFPARIAVEFAGGTLRKLGVKEGDKMKFDIEGLKARAR